MKLLGAVGLLLLVAWGSGCGPSGTRTGQGAIIQPGERPDPSGVEADTWMAAEKFEQELKTSGRVMEDPALNRYVHGILCNLVPDYCSDIRVYIVQNPDFNATMAPNGALSLWTGMLLRLDNEAELAVVLGHETTHYLHRHTLQWWTDARAKLDALVFVQLAAVMGGAAAGMGRVGSAAGQVIGYLVQGRILAFSRDNERDADNTGLDMVARAGYDPREAAEIWKALITERDAGDKSRPSIFFATHPTEEDRIAYLESRAQRLVDGREGLTVGRAPYQEAIESWRGVWLRDELQRRDFKVTQVLLRRLIEQGSNLDELYFFRGELYRLRGEDGDIVEAIASYRKALEAGNSLAETHRSLGLALARRGDRAGARHSYENYLRLRPDAGDRKMIEFYISELK